MIHIERTTLSAVNRGVIAHKCVFRQCDGSILVIHIDAGAIKGRILLKVVARRHDSAAIHKESTAWPAHVDRGAIAQEGVPLQGYGDILAHPYATALPTKVVLEGVVAHRGYRRASQRHSAMEESSIAQKTVSNDGHATTTFHPQATTTGSVILVKPVTRQDHGAIPGIESPTASTLCVRVVPHSAVLQAQVGIFDIDSSAILVLTLCILHNQRPEGDGGHAGAIDVHAPAVGILCIDDGRPCFGIGLVPVGNGIAADEGDGAVDVDHFRARTGVCSFSHLDGIAISSRVHRGLDGAIAVGGPAASAAGGHVECGGCGRHRLAPKQDRRPQDR